MELQSKAVKLKSFSNPLGAATSSIFKIVAICIAIFPIFLLVPLLVQNAINLPLMDQWDTPVSALLKAVDGTLSFSDLIAQHNESRLLFPRLLFLGMAFFTGWDTRYEVLVIFIVACLIAYQVYRLSQITIRGSTRKRLLLILLANLLIFSPVQSENWLWGIQLVTFIPIACITTALVVSYSNVEVKLKTLILIALCTVSTYSYANGMLSWFLVFPSAILISMFSQNQGFKTQLWLMLGGVIGCLANLSLYFHTYFKPSTSTSFSLLLMYPLRAINFFLIFLGNPLGISDGLVETIETQGHGQGETARIIGLGLLILFGCALFYLFKCRKDRQLLSCSIPWIVIGAYTCVSGLAITAGRLGYGYGAATLSRYTTFSVYLIVSLIYLFAIIASHANRNRHLKGSKKVRAIPIIFVCLITLFLMLHTFAFIAFAKTISLTHRAQLNAKACLLFVNFIDEQSTFKTYIYPNGPNGEPNESIKPRINRLNQVHLLKPPLVESPNVLAFAEKGVSYAPEAHGYLDAMTQISETEITAVGWAVLPERKQPADAVVLAYETSTSEPRAFAIAAVMGASPDVAKVLKNQAYRNVRWSKTIAIDKLPRGAVKLSAWAFDTETRHMFRLANAENVSGEFTLPDRHLRTPSN